MKTIGLTFEDAEKKPVAKKAAAEKKAPQKMNDKKSDKE